MTEVTTSPRAGTRMHPRSRPWRVGRVPRELSGQIAWGSTKRAVGLALFVYLLSRLFFFTTAWAISIADHLSVSLVLRSWDAKYYLWAAHHGYPTTHNFHLAKPDAFFPLYPAVIRAVHFVMQVPWAASAVLVAVVSGGFLVVAGTLLASAVWGAERAAPAGMLLAAFPGSVVAGLAYADPLGLALCATFLLLVQRRRYLWAGLAGMAATACFSLVIFPIVAVVACLVIAERRWEPVISGVLSMLGAAGYLVYLWVHMGTPFFWFRLERVKWHSGLGLSLRHGTLWALQSDWETGLLTSVCVVLGATGLIALKRTGAPASWIVFSLVIYLISLFDMGTHLTVRLLYAMFPAILAAGSRLRREWIVPVISLSMLGLCLCLVIYAPQNWIFFNP